MDIKVGTKVLGIDNEAMITFIGLYGYIVEVDAANDGFFLVEFERDMCGHYGDDRTVPKMFPNLFHNCWWFDKRCWKDYLRIVEDYKVVLL